MNNQSSQTPAPLPSPVAPRTPTPFHGEIPEDVEDWIQDNERVVRHNGWVDQLYLQNLYFSPKGTARHQFENHEASPTSQDICVAELKRTFTSQHRRQQAQYLLQKRFQAPNKSVNSFVEDVLRLTVLADRQATDDKQLRFLMRDVKSDIFGVLIRNPPTTVDRFAAEATNIERELAARANTSQTAKPARYVT